MTKIGIQGAKGSFSEEAAHYFAKNHGLEKFQGGISHYIGKCA